MITKHRVSNDIAMRGETDMAPPLLHIREKENIPHKETKARSSDSKNIGVVFDAPLPDLTVHTRNKGKN